MTRWMVRPALLVSLVALSPATMPAALYWQPAPGSPLPVWMAGCWAGERGGERFHERWIAADASTLLALAHTTSGGRMTAFEFLRVVARGAHAVYIAQPDGAPPTEFTSTSVSAERVVFENPAHDFPRRVVYERSGRDRLTATIDGGVAGGKRIDFPMRRVPCGE